MIAVLFTVALFAISYQSLSHYHSFSMACSLYILLPLFLFAISNDSTIYLLISLMLSLFLCCFLYYFHFSLLLSLLLSPYLYASGYCYHSFSVVLYISTMFSLLLFYYYPILSFSLLYCILSIAITLPRLILLFLILSLFQYNICLYVYEIMVYQ